MIKFMGSYILLFYNTKTSFGRAEAEASTRMPGAWANN